MVPNPTDDGRPPLVLTQIVENRDASFPLLFTKQGSESRTYEARMEIRPRQHGCRIYPCSLQQHKPQEISFRITLSLIQDKVYVNVRKGYNRSGVCQLGRKVLSLFTPE